jgi:hypothetical protein
MTRPSHSRYTERRRTAIRDLKHSLQRSGSPRRDMLLVVLVTGTAAFWICYLLLSYGVVEMWIRYPMAVLASYPVFVAMLRIWLRDAGAPVRKRDRSRESSWDLNPDLPIDIGSAPAEPFSGGGGFGGGGVGRSWSGGDSFKSSVTSSPKSGGKGGNFSLDIDDAALIIIPILVALSVLIYGFYVAPAILAELLLDGALMAGLYHQFKGVPRQHWIRTCVRKTFWLFVVTAVLLGIAGWATQSAYPHATSIGVLWDTLVR